MECFRSEHSRLNPKGSAAIGRLLFFPLLLLILLLSGCEFFSSEQERRGVNPKPFNSQPSWEANPYSGIGN